MENKELKTIIYSRIDLKENENKRIEDIHIKDFRIISDIFSEDLYIFVDDDFTTKILKSRFTDSEIIKNYDFKIIKKYDFKKRFFNFFRF